MFLVDADVRSYFIHRTSHPETDMSDRTALFAHLAAHGGTLVLEARIQHLTVKPRDVGTLASAELIAAEDGDEPLHRFDLVPTFGVDDQVVTMQVAWTLMSVLSATIEGAGGDMQLLRLETGLDSGQLEDAPRELQALKDVWNDGKPIEPDGPFLARWPALEGHVLRLTFDVRP